MNKLYVCKSVMSVRMRGMGHSGFHYSSQHGSVIWGDQMVKVLGEVIEIGSSKWVPIAYIER